MSKTILLLTALVASTNCMVQFGDMLPRRTDAHITPPPPEPTSYEANDELRRRANADAALEGYTSLFGTWTPVYCPSGSTFRKFSTTSYTDTWAACCPTTGVCNFNYECFADRADKWDGAVESCKDTCDTGYIYKTAGDPSPAVMIGCWQRFSLYMSPKGGVTDAGQGGTDNQGSSPSSGAANNGSSPSSAGLSASQSASNKGNTASHPIIVIVGAVVAGLIVLALIGGLVVYICILRKRAGSAKDPNSPHGANAHAVASATELVKLDSTPPTAPATAHGNAPPSPWAGKVELPTDFAGYQHYEMGATPAVGHAQLYGRPGQTPEMGVASPAQPHAQPYQHGGQTPELGVASPAMGHAQLYGQPGQTPGGTPSPYHHQQQNQGGYFQQGMQPGMAMGVPPNATYQNSNWGSPHSQMVSPFSAHPSNPSISRPGTAHAMGTPGPGTPGRPSPMAGSAVPYEMPAGNSRFNHNQYTELPG